VTEQWVAKKLEVLVDVPEQVDLEWLRGSGPQPHEQLQPEEPATSSQAGGLSALAAAAGTTVFDLILQYVHGSLQTLHAGNGGWQQALARNLDVAFPMWIWICSLVCQHIP